MYTKAEMREGTRVLISAMKYLETVCRDQDVDHRPWVSGDHPLSVAHWILAQCRFKSASMLRGVPGDPEVQATKKRAFTSAQNARAGHFTSEVRLGY
jgi:hypothetical protein